MVMGLIQLKNANKYFNSLSLPFYGPDAPPQKKNPEIPLEGIPVGWNLLM